MNFFFLFFFLTVFGTILSIQTTQINQNELCRDGKFRLIEHETYCDYYYRCEDGHIIEQKCPNGLVFAGYRRGMIDHCGYPYIVGCPDGVKIMGRKLSFSLIDGLNNKNYFFIVRITIKFGQLSMELWNICT